MDSFNMNEDIEQLKKQLDQIEKTVYRIESDTIKLHKKLDVHIDRIWDVYKTLKNPIQSVTKFFKR